MRVVHVLLLAAIFACTGCLSPVSIRPEQYPAKSGKRADPAVLAQQDSLEGQWHSLRVQPATKAKITACDKINPVWWLGNADEPIPPDWYRPNAPMRTFLWHLRNPMHNFSHYVIGVGDKETVRSGRYIKGVSKPSGGWNFCVTKYKHLRLPFADYHRKKFEFYFGWRVGGNFGIKCNWHDENQAKPPNANEQKNSTPNSGP